jgi:NitT/TauT family transport system permease protein
LQLFRHVLFWAALPHILTGVKTATAISWAIVVAAELIAAQAGLGFLVMDAATFFRVPDVYLGIIFIGLIGLALEAVTRSLERGLLHWQGR